MFVTVLDYLKSIPAAFWSAVTPALFALGGVWLSNANSRRQLKLQLAHSSSEGNAHRDDARRQKREDREMQLRREVFLDAFDGVIVALQCLARLSDVNSSLTDIGKTTSDAFGKIARVRAVGTASTIEAITSLMTVLVGAQVTSSVKRGALDVQVQNLKNIDAAMQREGSQYDKWFEIQSQILLQGPMPQDRFNYLDGRIKIHQREFARLMAARAGIAKTMDRITLDILDALIEHQTAISPASAEASAALRRELGFAGLEEDRVKNALLTQERAAREALKKLVELARSRVDNADSA